MLYLWHNVWKNDVSAKYYYDLTGWYNRYPYKNCNLNDRITEKIPVVLHNLNGYEWLETSAIPSSMEKYMPKLIYAKKIC